MADGTLRGVWVAMPTPFDRHGKVDPGVVMELMQRYKAAGLHGAYTTGTDGELHVLDDDEFSDLVSAFARAAEATGMPVQVGCGANHTGATIAHGRVAREHGIGRIQTILPAWIPLNDDEVVRYYAAIQAALPETELIHYNVPRSGRTLAGPQYRRVLEVAPKLVGSKHTSSDLETYAEVIEATPGLAHFACDPLVVAAALYGCPGFYSFIANLSPGFALAMWGACERGEWPEAARLSAVCLGFFRRWKGTCREINSSSALAKIATAAGVLEGMPLRIKEPYTSGEDRHVQALRELVRAEFPDLVWG